MKARYILSILLSAAVALGLTSCQKDDKFEQKEKPAVGFDENGASLAVFSVAEGHTVHFSRGNLQYQPTTGIWRFAENQYDTIGEDNIPYLRGLIHGINRSTTYTGWIDIFTFFVDCSGLDISTFYKNQNLPDTTPIIDWAWHNAIQNGGNKAYFWRTLSKDEWLYLLRGRPNADFRCGTATVNGVNGLVILPDEWTPPQDVTFTYGFHNYSNANVFSAKEWLTLQEAGAIFMPAEGIFNGEYLYGDREWGGYWTSTAVYYAEEKTYYVNHMSFSGYGMIDIDVVYCALDGYAVRPVLEERHD